MDNDKVKKFCCTYENCKASFPKKSKLVVHERTHTGERPFKCEYPDCDKSYTSKSHLKRHVDSYHLELKESYKCKICSLTLSNLSNYKRHQKRIHDPNKKFPFSCKECSQGFYKKHQLSEHMYIHNGEVPYKCPHCNFGFTKRGHLTKHLRNHREYNCSCGQVFHRWSELLRHKRIQHRKNSVKEHVCDKCNKHFAQKASLKEHLKRHEERKDVFVCPEKNCSRQYFYKRNLLQHIRVIHRDSPFICNVPGCKQTLCSKYRLQRHLQIHEQLRLGIKPKMVRRKRASRKGCKGTLTRSVILKLCGLSGRVPSQVENAVISGKKIDDIDSVVIESNEEVENDKENCDNPNICSDENLNHSKLLTVDNKVVETEKESESTSVTN